MARTQRTRVQRQRKNTRKTKAYTRKGGARFNADPDYVETQELLFCGKHAFNNIVGGELMRLEDIYEVLQIPEDEQDDYEGNIDNVDLQKIINNMHMGEHYDDLPHYSAFFIDTLASFSDTPKERGNITPFDLEKNEADAIFGAPAFKTLKGTPRVMSEAIKGYIKTLYINFLMLYKYTPNFSGLIFQVNTIDKFKGHKFTDGHYVAIKHLKRDGTLQMIDSIGPTVYDPIPFFSEDFNLFRENCARLISMLFEKAGITYRATRINPMQFIVVKPREIIPMGNGYNMKNVLNTRFGVGTVRPG